MAFGSARVRDECHVTAAFHFLFVNEDSVPVAEVVGVEEGRVEILPRKSVEDTDKDFTGEALLPGSVACALVSSDHTA